VIWVEWMLKGTCKSTRPSSEPHVSHHGWASSSSPFFLVRVWHLVARGCYASDWLQQVCSPWTDFRLHWSAGQRAMQELARL
jgi:hypothetical protein